jgi:SAM-dependent methyltransferase
VSRRNGGSGCCQVDLDREEEVGVLKYDPVHTAAHYDRYGVQEQERWSKSARARFEQEVYRRHLATRIASGDEVLDAGCGPGTFARLALDLGAQVTCLDISAVQLEGCQADTPGAEAYVLGSVTDLDMFETGSFDVALALGGPVSYCLDRAEDAVRELRRVTRTGGRVGLSVMSLYGTVHRFLPGILPFPVEVNEEILRTGDLSRAVNDGHECHLYRVEELRDLLSGAGLDEIELHASGWLVPNGEFDFPEVGSEAWHMLLDAELRASAETPGAGTHIIAWARA